MKLVSWNVNGIRAVRGKGFLEWLSVENPDVLCLQETKAERVQLDEALAQPPGYTSYWCSAARKGYSGVALYTKQVPGAVEYGIGDDLFDCEGRTIAADFGDFWLFNIYFPNGGAGNRRVPFKMAFYERFQSRVEALRRRGKNVIICGDVNTAHTEIDLARPRENQKNTGFLPEERAWVSRFLEAGFVDTFRRLCPDAGHYTWWDYKTGARARDVGWRIDYFFVNEAFFPRVRRAFILKDVAGSDHCPVGIEIEGGPCR